MVEYVCLVSEVVAESIKSSGRDKEVLEEISILSFTRLGLPLEKVCVIQCGSLCDEKGEQGDFHKFVQK